MKWQHKGWSIESGLAKGRKPPEWYWEEPVIVDEDRFYLKAFNTLGTSRLNGMSVGPIPWDKILDYGIRFGLDSEMLDPFLKIILELDEAYLKELNKKQEKTK